MFFCLQNCVFEHTDYTCSIQLCNISSDHSPTSFAGIHLIGDHNLISSQYSIGRQWRVPRDVEGLIIQYKDLQIIYCTWHCKKYNYIHRFIRDLKWLCKPFIQAPLFLWHTFLMGHTANL